MELADSPRRQDVAEDELDLAPVTERLDYPPILDAVLPAMILAVSVAYAWSLRDLVNAEMNLLLLKPLLVVIWALLLVVVAKDVVPAVAAQFAANRRAGRTRIPLRQRFAAGTEAGAGLVVAATFVFSVFGTGNGATVYLAGLFVYLVVAGWLMGDRRPLVLIGRSALCAAGLYVIMGILLGVPL